MTLDDLDAMAGLLGDAEVMRYYPRPKTRAEARGWIEWNLRNYAEHGYGLWIIETHDGDFLGDCGLTWQEVAGERFLEVGYHVVPERQGRGHATEAAQACVSFAHAELGLAHVIAIINPDNVGSRRVAERVGMRVEKVTTTSAGEPIVVYGVVGGHQH